MDKIERLLKHLPRPVPATDLAMRVRITVHRRHIRRVWFHRAISLTFGLSGLMLALPGFSMFFTVLGAPGIPWLMQSLDFLQMEAPASALRLWNGMFSWQFSLQSSLIVSLWIGIILMMLGLFFGVDRRVFLDSPLKGDV